MGLGLIIQRRSHFPSGGWPEWTGMGGRNASEYATVIIIRSKQSQKRHVDTTLK